MTILLITLGISAPSILLIYLHLLQVFRVELLKVRGDVPHQGGVHDELLHHDLDLELGLVLQLR